MRHLGSGRGCRASGYFRAENICSFSIMFFFSFLLFFFFCLQMDSLYSLVVWHATLLKTDHCALFVLRFSTCAFVLRNVCTPNLALSEGGKV